jgi:hypothetical protein
MTKILEVKVTGEGDTGGMTIDQVVARQQAIMENQAPGGVVPLVCGICGAEFGAINAAQAKANAEDGYVELCPGCTRKLRRLERIGDVEAMERMTAGQPMYVEPSGDVDGSPDDECLDVVIIGRRRLTGRELTQIDR